MAPPPPVVVELYTSSLELDARSAPPLHRLVARADDTTTVQHGVGSTPPQNINNAGFFALFAILGVALVIASLWFFFWAKNGGFRFEEGDWDDYKSTVLRRKGPDGKTLSNATKSTKLGGSTIAGSQHYAWQKNAALSVVGKDEKGRKGILAKRGWAGTHSVLYSDDYMTESFATETVSDEMTQLQPDNVDLEQGHGHSKRYRDRDVRQYKKEKPARVGGLNRIADSSHYDYTNSDRSDLMSETVLSSASDQPILPKKDSRQREQERAERKAREEAAKMERRWRREAEAAAAALAHESTATKGQTSKKSAAPSRPSPSKQRQRRESSRSASPKKRDFSYQNGPESETLSTAYTQSTAPSQRTASYYDSYRPKNTSKTRHSSPKKKQSGAPSTRSGGYRRGGTDSDLE